MTVVQLDRFRDSDTEALLRKLLARGGELDGVTLTLRRKDGQEESYFTGLYEADPEKALSATMRLSWQLTQLLDSASS